MEGQKGMWIDLDSIINDYLTESEQPNTKYWKCYHLAYRCMDDLGLDFFYRVKTVLVPLNGNKTLSLPDDCLQWTKLGYFDAGGAVITIQFNGAFKFNDVLRGVRFLVNNNRSDGWFFHNYYSGDSISDVYSLYYSGMKGDFTADANANTLNLPLSFPYDSVVIEYVANPQSRSATCRVPVQFREAIISWLWWKDNKVSVRRGFVGLAQERKDEYYNNRRLGRSRYKPLRIHEGLSAYINPAFR